VITNKSNLQQSLEVVVGTLELLLIN